MEFSVPRPIVQVFHLMVWTQHYLKLHNCWRFQDQCYNQHPSPTRRSLKKTPWWKGKLKRLFFNESSMNINISLVESHQRQVGVGSTFATAFDICSARSIQHSLHALTSINVTYIHYFSNDSSSGSSSSCGRIEIAGYPVRVIHELPLMYVYYTEADQIVRFDSIDTLHAVKAASNATTYFLGFVISSCIPMIQQYIHPFILKCRLIITYLLYVLRSILYVSIYRPLFTYCMYTCIHTVHTYIRT